MQSDQFPIEINGERFFVDRTFAGEPAMFVIQSNDVMQHVSGSGTFGIKAFLGMGILETGTCVIVATDHEFSEPVVWDVFDAFSFCTKAELGVFVFEAFRQKALTPGKVLAYARRKLT